MQIPKLVEAGYDGWVIKDHFGPHGQTMELDRRAATVFSASIDAADVSTDAQVTLYDALGAAITLGTTDRIVITNLMIHSEISSGNVIVYLDNNANSSPDAGETVVKAVNAQDYQMKFDVGRVGAKAAKLRVKASTSGYVYALFNGFIARSLS